MEAQKMLVVPETFARPEMSNTVESDEPQPRPRGRPKGSDSESLLITKLTRAINIAIKLSHAQTIDQDGHLLDAENQRVPNADLISLIQYAVSKGRARIGESEFIRALHLAGVSPSLIGNDDIRMKLMSYGSSQTVRRGTKRSAEVEPVISEVHRPRKRLRQDPEEEEEEDDDVSVPMLEASDDSEPPRQSYKAIKPLKIVRSRAAPYNKRSKKYGNWEIPRDDE